MRLNCNSTHKDGNKIYQIFTAEKDILRITMMFLTKIVTYKKLKL